MVSSVMGTETEKTKLFCLIPSNVTAVAAVVVVVVVVAVAVVL